MIKPDWDVFKAKFSENPQRNFEWLCYLLFCRQFDKPYGLFRYKNQCAIETNPINVEGKETAFQAKFYDRTLSNHDTDIIEVLSSARRKWPNLKVLYFYTNQEWCETSSKKEESSNKPSDQIKVEAKAKELNIELIWCTTSFFESEFCAIDCQDITKCFFSIKNTVFDLIKQEDVHSKTLLNQVKSEVNFEDKSFSLERNEIFEQLKNNTQPIAIITGVGGVGKTVEVKKLYNELNTAIPFYVFKATELELNRLDDFRKVGSIYEFIECYGDSERKIIVIDSAEKLLELKNPEPAKEFITLLLENKWQIIFTTRDHYYENLYSILIDAHKIIPLKFNIPELEPEYLNTLSEAHGFPLPSDKKLLNLLRIPFYFNEYLKVIKSDELFNYISFKDELWKKKILCNSPKRAQVFLSIALKRANEGGFYINPDIHDTEIAEKLYTDGLLGYENDLFFITHDIYEEWALEKNINIAFISKQSNMEFFEKIGQSLPIRRSFRNWVSENLLLENADVISFIEELLDENMLQSFWKDEVIVSILSSNYSEFFFQNAEHDLLKDNMRLLRRICDMLRIACKEIDDTLFKRTGSKTNDPSYYIYFYTIPKGPGWSSLINFVYQNLDKIDIVNIDFILPILFDWNNAFKTGSTTKLAGLIALQYYKLVQVKDVHFRADDVLLKSIAYGCSEIKAELSLFLTEIIENPFDGKRDPYADLVKFILTKHDCLPLVKLLPKETLALANKYWLKNYSQLDKQFTSLDKEALYGITDDYSFRYSPESAYQTPIYWLLQSDTLATIDYILTFTNKVTENKVAYFGEETFSKSKILNNDHELEIYLDLDMWGAYRGGGPTPSLIKSVLMALEKFFLDYGEKLNDLDSLLLYLIKKTNSSAIIGVVASIVLAYPDKTFKTACLLFKVKHFFIFDIQRLTFDRKLKNNLIQMNNMRGSLSENLYETERLAACDNAHRRSSLEYLLLCYQDCRTETISINEVEVRRQQIWKILDQHYAELSQDDTSEEVLIWRLTLARVDIRKMTITTEANETRVVISYNPELPQEVKQFVEKNQASIKESDKYSTLKLWAMQKLNVTEGHQEYDLYDHSPKTALSHTKELIAFLHTEPNAQGYEASTITLNRSTPIYVCAALLKHYHKQLLEDEVTYCKNLILDAAENIFKINHLYQMGDGSDICFAVMPDLLLIDLSLLDRVKTLLLLALFKNDSTSVFGTDRFSDIAIIVINHLWSTHPTDAESLLFGYLVLRSKYSELTRKVIIEHRTDPKKVLDVGGFNNHFIDENKNIINEMIINKLDVSRLNDIENLSLEFKTIALRLVPNNTNFACKSIFTRLSTSTLKHLLSNDASHHDYKSKNDFFRKFAEYVLAAPKNNIVELLNPFIQNFNSSSGTTEMLNAFVLAQDKMQAYENFWFIWELLRDKIMALIENNIGGHQINELIKAYLFVQQCEESASEWHTFEPHNTKFFADIAKKLAKYPSTLFAFAKLLNSIGRTYHNEGVTWIASILESNTSLVSATLDQNTTYYVHRYINKYIYENYQAIKRTKELKSKVLLILDFLINKGEVSGYLLRENIL